MSRVFFGQLLCPLDIIYAAGSSSSSLPFLELTQDLDP